ncbi:DsrH/TusB family sulfur relay protein [Corallincola platygyrae]|uniref:DsrH/TusB family sulfur relay protein n=1 Tax=Corallincola platygyrae TaxID=1193278 RepID=A0ABW4XGM2_9GAMM
MTPLIIFNKPPEQGSLSQLPANAAMLLRADACFALPTWLTNDTLTNMSSGVYVLEEDAQARGISELPSTVKSITIDQMVELTLSHHPIISW